MKIIRRTLFAVLLVLSAVVAVQAQTPNEDRPLPLWGIKTNLLYDATATFNLGVEFRTGEKTSLDLPVSYNPWTFKNNRKWKHVLVQPELRWWMHETFAGHFFGVHGHYAFYNVGNLPGPFSAYMKNHRLEGWLAGAGLSYGYRWNFRNPRLALEATVGVGYAYQEYDRYNCIRCGDLLGSNTKHYFGPTKAGLNLIVALGKPVPVQQVFVPAPHPPYEPAFAVSFILPQAEEVKARTESGSAFLDFAVGRSEIVPNFRDNAAELKKICETIELVKNDPNATVTGVTITGYASPEGNYDSNLELSARRAEALSHYIGANYSLPNNVFGVWSVGEDWAGLDSLVSISSLSEKEQLLEIIRSGGDADAREQRLRAVAKGAPYRKMFSDMYPRLRRSDYVIHYTVIPFTIEQGKEVIQTRPGNLSLNEIFLIANTYEPGSQSFNRLFETAVQVFPESDVANVNAAASALGRKDAASAARYLSKVRTYTPEYWNNVGVLAWLQGDKAKAADAFTRAGTHGTANTVELERHLRSIANLGNE